MRISDWSSDVCSSDLPALAGVAQERRHPILDRCGAEYLRVAEGDQTRTLGVPVDLGFQRDRPELIRGASGGSHGLEIGRASCRERVCPYVYLSVFAVSLKKKDLILLLFFHNNI